MHTSPFYNRLLTRVTSPAEEPLTLNETKSYLRLDHDDEDSLISDLIVTARMNAENWLRRSLINQSWKLGYDDYLPSSVSLPMGPVGGISNITIVNRDNSTQLVNDALYSLNSAKNRVLFDSCIQGFHIEIVYTTGYGSDAADVPAPIRQAMLCHIAHMYENRGEVANSTPEQCLSLLMPFREVLL